MHRVEFEPTISVFEGAKKCSTLNRTATASGKRPNQNLKCPPTVNANKSVRFAADFSPRRPGFGMSDHVGFVMDKVALRQVFCEYFGFPLSSRPTIRAHSSLSIGLSLTPRHELKKNCPPRSL
jgi:hypothetical protein